MDWQHLMTVLGGAVMKEEDLRGSIISFMRRKITIFIPSICYIDCIYCLSIVHCAKSKVY